MIVHSLEHQSYEGPGRIADWAAARGHALTRTALYAGGLPPPLESFDLLVVMGGSMSIHEHRDHPWLAAEKRFLGEVIAAGKPVLGICLGAQLLADALGGKVFQNAEKEIGWWPVRVCDRRAPFAAFPEELTVMHWHGDTFSLPPGARAAWRTAQAARSRRLCMATVWSACSSIWSRGPSPSPSSRTPAPPSSCPRAAAQSAILPGPS